MRGVLELHVVIEEKNEGEDTDELEVGLPDMLMGWLHAEGYLPISVEVTYAFSE